MKRSNGRVSRRKGRDEGRFVGGYVELHVKSVEGTAAHGKSNLNSRCLHFGASLTHLPPSSLTEQEQPKEDDSVEKHMVYSSPAVLPADEEDQRERGEEKNSWFGPVQIPVCIAWKSQKDSNQQKPISSDPCTQYKARLEVHLLEREMIPGNDSETGRGETVLDLGNLLRDEQEKQLTIQLRNKRGRGFRGTLTLGVRFVPSNNASSNNNNIDKLQQQKLWETFVQAPSSTKWNLRIFVIDLRTSSDKPCRVVAKLAKDSTKSRLVDSKLRGSLSDTSDRAKRFGVSFNYIDLVNVKQLASDAPLQIIAQDAVGNDVGSAGVSLADLSPDGKSWLQLGKSSCVQLLAVPIEVTGYPSTECELASLLHIQVENVSGPTVSGSKVFLVAHMFPIIHGASRGRVKFRDVVRTSTHTISSSSASWGESLSLPWIQKSMTAGDQAVLHLSAWAEETSSKAFLGEVSIPVTDLLEKSLIAKKNNAAKPWAQLTLHPSTIGSQPVQALLSAQFATSITDTATSFPAQQEGDMSLPKPARPYGVHIIRLRGAKKRILKTQKVSIAVSGYYGDSGQVQLPTRTQAIPEDTATDVVFNQILDFGNALQESQHENLDVELMEGTVGNSQVLAKGVLPLQSVDPMQDTVWVNLNLPSSGAKDVSTGESARLQVLVQLIFNPLDTIARREGDGLTTDFLSDVGPGKKKLSGQLPAQGVFKIHVKQVLAVSNDHDIARCNSLWVQMAAPCADWSWNSSLTSPNPQNSFAWDKKQACTKLQFQYSGKEKIPPTLFLCAQGQQAGGRKVTCQFQPVDLVAFFVRPRASAELSLVLDDCDTSGKACSVVMKLSISFRRLDGITPNTESKQSWSGPPFLSGNVHVSLLCGRKFTATDEGMQVEFSLQQPSSSSSSSSSSSVQQKKKNPLKLLSRPEENSAGNPVWKEEFLLPFQNLPFDSSPLLKLRALQDSKGEIGECTIVVAREILLSGHVLETMVPLRTPGKGQLAKKSGEVDICIQVVLDEGMQPRTAQGSPEEPTYKVADHVAKLRVLEMKSLDLTDYPWQGFVEPTIHINCADTGGSGETFPVDSVDRSRPVWNDLLEIPCFLGEKLSNSVLYFELKNDNSLSSDALIGTGSLTLEPGTKKAAVSEVEIFSSRNKSLKIGEVSVQWTLEDLREASSSSECSTMTGNGASLEYFKLSVLLGKKLRSRWGRIHRAVAKIVLHDKVLCQSASTSDNFTEENGEAVFSFGLSAHVWEQELPQEQLEHLRVQVFDATSPGELEPLGEVLFGKNPEWVTLSWMNSSGCNDGDPKSMEKGPGQVRVSIQRVKLQKGSVHVQTKSLSGLEAVRVPHLDEDEHVEFAKVRLAPKGKSWKTPGNHLSSKLEIPFDPFHGGVFRNMQAKDVPDKLFFALVVDDRSLAENVLGVCELDLAGVVGKPNQPVQVETRLVHPLTMLPTQVQGVFELCFTCESFAEGIMQENSGSEKTKPKEEQVLRMVALKRLKDLFYSVDQDHSGEIDLKEFTFALQKNQQLARVLGMEKGESAKNMFREIDVNGGSTITWDEFVNFCTTRVQEHSVRGCDEVCEEKETEASGGLCDRSSFSPAIDGGDEAVPVLANGGEEKSKSRHQSKSRPKKSAAHTKRSNERTAKRKAKTKSRSKSATRQVSTHVSKYDELDMARMNLDDPVELRKQLEDVKKEKLVLEDTNRKLQTQIRRVAKKGKGRSSPVNSPPGSPTGLPEPQQNSFGVDRMGDQALPSATDSVQSRRDHGNEEGEHTKSLRIKLEELEEKLRIQEQLHKQELEAMRSSKHGLQDEMDQLQQEKEDLVEQTKTQIEKLKLQKTKKEEAWRASLAKTLERKHDEPGSPIEVTKLRALEQEQDRRLSEAREKRRKESNAAARLQAAVRAVTERNRFIQMKVNRENAATLLQSLVRTKMAQIKYEVEREKQVIASKKIQAIYRGKKTRDGFNEQQGAATKIQSNFRAEKGRREAAKLRLKKESAVRIQAQLRKRNSKMLFDQMRSQRHKETEAAIKLQSQVRRHRAKQEAALKRDEWEQENKENGAATAIQKTARRRRAQKDVQHASVEKLRKQNAAKLIQRRYKGGKRNSTAIADLENWFRNGRDSQTSTTQDKGGPVDVEKSRALLSMFKNSYTGATLTKDRAKRVLMEGLYDVVGEDHDDANEDDLGQKHSLSTCLQHLWAA